MAATIYKLPDVVDLFDRSYRLQVDDLLITELQVTFDVKRSLSAKVPNSAEVTVYNLSVDNRKKLQAKQNVFVSIEAGFSGQNTLLFRGDLREAWSHFDGTEWVTEVSSASAVVKRKQQRVNTSFPAGTSVRQVIQHCAAALRVGLGNTDKQAAAAKLWIDVPAFTTGYVASGDAVSQLDRVCRSCGIEWSIQDNVLQLLPRGQALQEQGVILASDSGLLGSPELGKGGVVRCKTLMIPGLHPGRRVELRTAHVRGIYRVETTHHKGGFSEGDEWGCDVELKLLSEVAEASTGKSYGALVPGNIDLARRPYVKNSDGSISTVRSMSYDAGGQTYLIPTVSYDGRILSDNAAIRYFQQRKQHLGIYRTPQDADRAAEEIHNDQALNPPANTLHNGLGPKDLQ